MAVAAAPDRDEPSEKRARSGSYARFLVLLVIGVLAFRTLLFTPFTIPSESMLPGLAKGDYLVASKWPYGYSRWSLPFDAPLPDSAVNARLPKRGDVAIFRHPIDGTEYIKRVIGLPGDEVAMRGGAVLLNGAPLAQRRIADFRLEVAASQDCAWGAAREGDGAGGMRCRYARLAETLPDGRSYAVLDFGPTAQDEFGPVRVPAGHVFLLGDNRDNSQDSRFAAAPGGGVGMVPTHRLVGRFEGVLFSTAGWPEWLRLGGRRAAPAP